MHEHGPPLNLYDHVARLVPAPGVEFAACLRFTGRVRLDVLQLVDRLLAGQPWGSPSEGTDWRGNSCAERMMAHHRVILRCAQHAEPVGEHDRERAIRSDQALNRPPEWRQLEAPGGVLLKIMGFDQ